MTVKKQIGILIIHFKDSPHTLPCLDSLTKVTSEYEFKIYILCSQCTSIDTVKNHPLKPQLIETKHNLGFPGANNRLILEALNDNVDYIILLNNDTLVDENFVDSLIHQLDKQEVGMVCPKIYFAAGNEYHHDNYKKSELGRVIWYAGGIIDWRNVYAFHWGVDEVDHGQFNMITETQFATGCCVAIRSETIRNIGMMNDKYFLYYEDTDWSMRVRKAGYKIIVEPKSIIWHKNAGSSNGPGSQMHLYYQTRNRYLFAMKYAPIKTKLHVIRQYISYLRQDGIQQQAARDAIFGKFGPQNS